IVKLYTKYKKSFDNLEPDLVNKQIKNVSEIWTKKNYWWWTVSPFGRSERITQYYDKYNEKDSSYFKPNYEFYFGVSGQLNYLMLYPNKLAIYSKLGANLSKAGNLSTLSSFTYETRQSMFSSGSSVTSKIISGTAYR